MNSRTLDWIIVQSLIGKLPDTKPRRRNTFDVISTHILLNLNRNSNVPVSVPACQRASVPACQRASVPACQRASVPACQRASVPACQRASVTECKRASVPAYQRASVPACQRASMPECQHVSVPGKQTFFTSFYCSGVFRESIGPWLPFGQQQLSP